MIKAQISQLIQSVVDGESSACEAYSMLKDIEVVVKSGLQVVKEGAMQEARDFNKNEVYYGGIWEYRTTATYLDFSKDEIYTNLSKQASERKKVLNQAFKNRDEQAFFDKKTGEEIPVLPVKTPASETLIYKPK